MSAELSKVFPLEGYGTWLERWLDWIDAYVESVRAYWNRDFCDLFNFASLFERSAARPEPPPTLDANSFRSVDPALLSRVSELQRSRDALSAAADAYLSPLRFKLGILAKCRGHRFLVSALELIESFLWPGREQWCYERFQHERDHFQDLLSAFRRDYLADVN